MNQQYLDKKKKKTTGILYTFLAFSSWGLLPCYWKLLQEVPALEILAHRILWSFLFIALLLFLSEQRGSLQRAVVVKKNLALTALCGVIISGNWYTYIWAVNTGRVVETSLGYYINPLIVVFLGMIVFQERLNPWQITAFLLALVGVFIMTIEYGQIPWVAVTLALTFASYGLLKKIIPLDAMVGLTMETFFLLPFALAYILFIQIRGTGSLGVLSLPSVFILMGTGIITATPLLWFAKGARRVEFSTIGFMQYIAPTITLYLGIFVFQEQFTRTHLLSFACIWTALLLFSFSLGCQLKRPSHPSSQSI